MVSQRGDDERRMNDGEIEERGEDRTRRKERPFCRKIVMTTIGLTLYCKVIKHRTIAN